MYLDILKRCKIKNYKFGFLGESYIEIENLSSCDTKSIERYFSLKAPYYCNRNAHYYSTSLDEIDDYYLRYQTDINTVLKSEIEIETKRFVLFSILAHWINDTAKVIGLLYAYGELREKYIEKLKAVCQNQSDAYINMMFDESIDQFDFIDISVFESIAKHARRLNVSSVRQYSEMDHPKILLKSFCVYEEYFRDRDLYVCPLQGASIIAPMYISMSKKLFKTSCYNYPMRFSYVRTSNYDDSHYLDLSIEDQVERIKLKYDERCKITLVDDNVGTGQTIRALKKVLSRKFKDVLTCVLECRWETKVNSSDYPAFDMNEIDILTPLEYRHYKRFDDEIDNIINQETLNIRYHENKFYALNFVYDNYDFDDFISNSELNNDNLHRLKRITDKYKTLTTADKV